MSAFEYAKKKKKITKPEPEVIREGSKVIMALYDEAQSAQEDVYELLKQQGIVKNPFEVFGVGG
jgi:hypothetical protein